MRKHLLLFGGLLTVLMFGCKHPTVFKEVLAPKMFSMLVPSYLNATSELFPGGKACLQYESDSEQVYLLVFDSTRENMGDNTLKTFYDSVASQPQVANAVISQPKLLMLKTDSAMVSEMTATLGKVPVFYRIEVIATPKYFYYILLWCKQDKKDALKADFDKILSSFNDINLIKV